MKVELNTQQVEMLILSVETALSQLNFAKVRHEEFSDHIAQDIELIKRLKVKLDTINNETYIPLTKYEMYLMINIASDYEELHEQPQDTAVNKVVNVKMNILDIIKSPLPYIDVISVRIAKE